jgi:hypothetical protein
MKAVLTFSILQTCLAFTETRLPKETVSSINDLYGPQEWSTQPTPPPSIELVKRKLGDNVPLAKRAATLSSGELLGYLADSNTCGFVNGEPGISPKL